MPNQTFTLSEVADATQANSDLLQFEVGLGELNESIDDTKLRSAETLKQLSLLKKEFEHDRKETDACRKSVDRKFDIVMQKLGVSLEDEEACSESLLKGLPDFVIGRKKEPFVKIQFRDGKEEDIFFSQTATRDLLASSTHRETVRKVLLHVHENKINELRNYTLTGRTFASDPGLNGSEKEESQNVLSETPEIGKAALPIRTILIVHATVRKLHPIDPLFYQLNPKKADEELEKLDGKTRGYITAVLNYFHRAYDSTGKKIQSPSTPSGESKPKKQRRMEFE